MTTPRLAPFGTWESPLAPATLFARPSPPMYPTLHEGRIYWLEGRAQEGGRVVLVRQEPDGGETCITPRGFNIRTRAHEYGGRCFVLTGDSVVFSNFSDQRLYRQRLDPEAAPIALTPERNADGSHARFADLRMSVDGRLLVFVCERAYEGTPPINTIAALSVVGDAEPVQPAEPVDLVTGPDFVASPELSVDGRRIAWLQWSHPAMPWDRSELAVAELHHSADGVRLVNTTVVAGGGRCSVCQPMFGRDGALYFVMDCDAAGEADPDNFWNLHVYSVGDVRRVTSELAEFGEPHWVFGSRRLVEVGAGQLVAVRTDAEGDRLVRIDAVSGGVAPVPAPFVEFSMLSSAAGDGVLMVAASAQREAAVVQLHATNAVTVVKAPAPVLADADVSVAEPLRYPTRDGGFAHAFFYAPTSTRYRGLPGTRPPLLVVVHGGPTARSSAAFNIVRQYWTTLGYAVLDVNHRGSTGYGRAYRQRLRGEWGELDVSDIADAVAQVVRDERVDPEKICIRGSSAGGYTVLRALTVHPGRFRAGASYYGIGSLITLAELTHKFEAHYVDVLIGEVFDPARVAEPTSRYRSRSPLFEMDRIESALIVFQGDEDKVVPVAVAREVVETLERNGVEHEYVEYKAEGHGFRRAETRIDALERETDFFRRALGLDAVSG